MVVLQKQERQVAEMVNERGIDIHHTTVLRYRAGVWIRNRQARIDPICFPQMILGGWTKLTLESR